MKLENATKGLCVICSSPTPVGDLCFCLKCKKPCVAILKDPLTKAGKLGIYDAKSDCCKADIAIAGKMTCSDPCHEKFVNEMEEQFGSFKKITDIMTGISYKIPVRIIIEHGINHDQLKKYPLWDEATR